MSIYREIGYPSFGILLSPIIAAAAMAFAICSLSQAGNAVFQGFLAMRKGFELHRAGPPWISRCHFPPVASTTFPRTGRRARGLRLLH
jgi:hypothetical protein